jgi:hypothetical protein
VFDNNVILNLKQRQMSFEMDTLCVISSLDLTKGDKYNEPVNEDVQSSIIENIYNITGCKEDYVNLQLDGELSWRSICSYDIDSEDALTRWKNKMYEVSTRRCTWITKVVCWIGSELHMTYCGLMGQACGCLYSA